MNDPCAVVGDIHGDSGRLASALQYLSNLDRPTIFVGDYINRGNDSKEVLDLLCLFADSHAATLLRGNHEVALLELLETGKTSTFLRHGGLRTIRSYFPTPRVGIIQEFIETFPSEHFRLLRGTAVYYEVDSLLVSHLGYDPRNPAARDLRSMATMPHPELLTDGGPQPSKLTVFGHYVQASRVPYRRGNLLCIDTGCGVIGDGPLTVALLPELVFHQF